MNDWRSNDPAAPGPHLGSSGMFCVLFELVSLLQVYQLYNYIIMKLKQNPIKIVT